MTEPFLRRTWIDVDLDALTENYRTACSLTRARVTCVLKSNAYGHGAVRVAQALAQAGCHSFAVSCVREGIELRRAGIEGEMLVLGLTEPPLLPEALRLGMTLTAASLSDLKAIEDACTAEKLPAAIHLKVDTGFHRLGFDCTEENAEGIAQAARSLKRARIEGLYSHLGLIGPERDRMQADRLLYFRDLLTRRGLSIPDVHLCDSIGLVRYPEWHLSRVRVGAILFGVRPARSEQLPFACRETLAFRTTVSQVRPVAAGEPVGYSDENALTHDAVIATLCAGYGDGYPRSLSGGRGSVLIRGRRAPVVGLVCMDQLMVDVTGIDGVVPGDTADLLGGGIPYGVYADWAHTNRNECLAILSRRPIRVYRANGRIVTVCDDLLGERRDFA